MKDVLPTAKPRKFLQHRSNCLVPFVYTTFMVSEFTFKCKIFVLLKITRRKLVMLFRWNHSVKIPICWRRASPFRILVARLSDGSLKGKILLLTLLRQVTSFCFFWDYNLSGKSWSTNWLFFLVRKRYCICLLFFFYSQNISNLKTSDSRQKCQSMDPLL